MQHFRNNDITMPSPEVEPTVPANVTSTLLPFAEQPDGRVVTDIPYCEEWPADGDNQVRSVIGRRGFMRLGVVGGLAAGASEIFGTGAPVEAGASAAEPMTVYDMLDSLPVANVESEVTEVIIRRPEIKPLPEAEPSIVRIVEMAGVPEIEATQLVSAILETHNVKPDELEGIEQAEQYVGQRLMDIEDAAYERDIRIKDAAIVKSTLAYAWTLSMYPALAKSLTKPELESLQDLIRLADKKTFQKHFSDAFHEFDVAATKEDDDRYPPATKHMIASLLATAQSLVDRKPAPKPKPEVEPDDENAFGSEESYRNFSTFYKPSKRDVKKLLPHAHESVFDKQYECIMRELAEAGLNKDPRVLAYIFATISVENPWFDSRISERGDLRDKPYYPFIGRGLTQLTWASNYIMYGRLIGLDLRRNPELVNRPDVDAKVLAMFMKRHMRRRSVRESIQGGDLRVARKGYNGGDNGLDRVRKAYNKAVPMFEKRAVTPLPTPRLDLHHNVKLPEGWSPPLKGNDCDPQDAEGYTYNLRKLAKAVSDNFGVKSYGGVIAPNDEKYGHSPTSDHYHGHAVDIMLDGRQDWSNFAKQQDITNWLVEHAVELNVRYIIVNNRIWNIEQQNEGWRLYSDDYKRPSTSDAQGRNTYILGHYEHVHVSVYQSTKDGSTTNDPDETYQNIIGDTCRIQQNAGSNN